MPENIVREEVETVHSCPGRHAASLRPPRLGPHQGPPSYLSIHTTRGTGPWSVECAISYRALRSASESGEVRCAKGPSAGQARPPFRQHAAKLRTYSSVRRVWRISPLRWMPEPRVDTLTPVAARVTTRRTSGARKTKAALAKQAPERGQKNSATRRPAAPKGERAGPLQCRENWEGEEPRCPRGERGQGHIHYNP